MSYNRCGDSEDDDSGGQHSIVSTVLAAVLLEEVTLRNGHVVHGEHPEVARAMVAAGEKGACNKKRTSSRLFNVL